MEETEDTSSVDQWQMLENGEKHPAMNVKIVKQALFRDIEVIQRQRKKACLSSS